MSTLRNTILASCAVGALAIAGGVSSASAGPIPPLSGTFGFSIYNLQTSTNGPSTAPSQQANSSNPLITPGDLVYTGNYTGSLNFLLGGLGTGSISSFLASGGGTFSNSIAGLTQNISTATFATTSVFVITGNVGSAVLQGAITHDDGVTLVDPTGCGTCISSASPTSADTSSYAGLTGAFTLYYVEANGLPAILDFTATPLPSTWIMMLSGLAGLGFLGWRRKDKALALAAAA
jgi:hypothetical protein